MVRVTYGAAEAGAPRRHPNLALAFALIAAALVACVGIVTYAKSTNALAPVETFQMTKLGTEYMVSEGGGGGERAVQEGGQGRSMRTVWAEGRTARPRSVVAPCPAHGRRRGSSRRPRVRATLWVDSVACSCCRQQLHGL